MSNHEAGRAALRVIAGTMLVVSVVALAAPAKHAGADVVLATGDELPGLGRIEVVVGQTCVAPDGAILTTVHAEDGRDALVCIDGSGPRVVVRSGDPEPTGRTFLELQNGDCSFSRDRRVIFSATTLRPVVGPDGELREWVEAAIYRAAPARLTRVLGTGDQTSGGTVEIWSSVDYAVSSAGTVLAHVFVGGGDLPSGQIFWGQHDWYLVTDAGLEIAFPSGLGWDDDGQDVNPGFPSLTEHGDFLAIGTIGYPLLRVSNALVEWGSGRQRVVARSTDLASDGVPYGAITDGFWPPRTGRGRLSVRGDTTVFAATATFASRGEYQTRFFRYSPGDSTPQLVFAPAAPGEASFFSPWIIDSNAGGAILFEAQGHTLFQAEDPRSNDRFFVARAGQPLQSVPHRDLGPCTADGCPGGLYPLALTDDGVVFSLVFLSPDEYRVTLETDLGSVAGTSCSMLPTVPPETPIATATPVAVSTFTAAPEPEPSDHRGDTPTPAICAGDCGADGVVTVGDLVTVVNIALGSMTMSSCTACDQDGSGQATVDEVVLAVDAALSGCRAIRRR